MVSIRALSTHPDLLACVRLQKRVWGDGFLECVPPTLLKASQQIGGIAAGAFDESDALLGFVFGLTGVRDGRPIHWSHMLGVSPEARGRGIGRMLKEHQRNVLRERGVRTIFWTFDPLAVGNAHLNLNLLGAQVVEYVPDMYPPTGSPLHGTVATDRFIVAWETDGSHRQEGTIPQADGEIQILSPSGEVVASPAIAIDGDSPAVLRIGLPTAFDSLLERDPATAGKWRMAVREGLMAALDAGYTVAGITTDSANGRPYYILSRVAGARIRASAPLSPMTGSAVLR